MQRKLAIAVIVTVLPALLLILWNLTYKYSDWAVIWIFFLTGMIFFGNWSLVIDHWKAERQLVLRRDSWIAKWLTGRIGAFLSSTFLVVVLVPALAWHALTLPRSEVVILLALAFASACMFLWMQGFLARHFTPPFDRILATGPSAWLIGLPFSAILFVVTWYEKTIPAEMFTASLTEAVQSGLGALPERRGWIAELLAFGYAFDATKMWLVVQTRDYPLLTLLFNLDMALFGFLAARASVVITHFVEAHYQGTQDDPA